MLALYVLALAASAHGLSQLETLSPFANATFSLARAAASPLLLLPPAPAECPPCSPFNCLLPAFTCLNNGASVPGCAR